MNKYSVIYADPPWRYGRGYSTGSVGRRDGTISAADHYKVMEIEDICALPVANIADDNCILFMWATPPLLPEAIRCIESWGFAYKTIAFCWVKLEPHGGAFFGIGMYTKSNCELCLLATKGKVSRVGTKALDSLILNSNRESQVITTQRSNNRSWKFHSAKPNKAYEKIERLVGDVPRVELFARNTRPGWDSIGNALDKKPIQEMLCPSTSKNTSDSKQPLKSRRRKEPKRREH